MRGDIFTDENLITGVLFRIKYGLKIRYYGIIKLYVTTIYRSLYNHRENETFRKKMPRRNLKWYGTMPSDEMRSQIRRCVRSYTKEIDEQCQCFGTMLTEKKHGTYPFTYINRLFLAIYKGEYVIVIEDKHLDIKSLINDFWDKKPDHHTSFQFCELFLDFIVKEHLEN